MDESLTIIIIILGGVTVSLSIFVAAKFWQELNHTTGHTKHLTHALTWQLVGEAILGLGTMIFAVAAHYNRIDYMSIELQSFMRFVMFAITALTTVHLWRTVINIQHN